MYYMGGQDPPMGRGNFEGGRRQPILKYRDTLRWAVQKQLNQSRCYLSCGLGWAQGIILDEGPDLCGKVQYWGGEGRPIVMYRDALLWAVKSKTAEPIEMPFGVWTPVGPRTHVLAGPGSSLVPPGEYHWTVSVGRWCGLLSNCVNHLLHIASRLKHVHILCYDIWKLAVIWNK